MYSRTVRLVILWSLLGFWCARIPETFGQGTDATTAYNQLVTAGRKALDAGKKDDALLAAGAAIEKLPERFEAYALGALVYQAKGELADARKLIAKALEKAPEAKKAASFSLPF